MLRSLLSLSSCTIRLSSMWQKPFSATFSLFGIFVTSLLLHHMISLHCSSVGCGFSTCNSGRLPTEVHLLSWTPTTTDATLPTYRRCSRPGHSATASRLLESYSRCNRPGATPSCFGKQFEPRWLRTCSDFHESHDCITAAHRELLPVQQTGSYSRSFTDRRGSFASIRFTRCWGAGDPGPGGEGRGDVGTLGGVLPRLVRICF